MPQGQDASVLVVEDNATNQLAIRALLDRFGVDADFVSTGTQAIAATQRKHYLLVLMDLMLPGVDGYAATRQIRFNEYSTGRHTPIVAVTAVDPSLSRSACISAGMDGFISKPIDPAELEDVLRKWLPPRPLHKLLEDLESAIRSEDLPKAKHLVHQVEEAIRATHGR